MFHMQSYFLMVLSTARYQKRCSERRLVPKDHPKEIRERRQEGTGSRDKQDRRRIDQVYAPRDAKTRTERRGRGTTTAIKAGLQRSDVQRNAPCPATGRRVDVRRRHIACPTGRVGQTPGARGGDGVRLRRAEPSGSG